MQKSQTTKVAGECAVRIAVRQRPLSDAEKAVLLAAEQGGAVGADDFIQRAGDMDHNVCIFLFRLEICNINTKKM